MEHLKKSLHNNSPRSDVLIAVKKLPNKQNNQAAKGGVFAGSVVE